MIPYEELVAALAHWRAKNGLPTGSAEYLGEMAPITGMPMPIVTPSAPPPAQASQRQNELDDVVELGSELNYLEEMEGNVIDSDASDEETRVGGSVRAATPGSDYPAYDSAPEPFEPPAAAYAEEEQFVEEYLSEFQPEPAVASAPPPSDDDAPLESFGYGGSAPTWRGDDGGTPTDQVEDSPSAPASGSRKKKRKGKR
jgi:hypothetical protein